MLPVSHKRILRLALRAVLRYRNAHGAISHGSLVQAQTRSCFIICAAARFACCGAIVGKSPFAKAKSHRMGAFCLDNNCNFDTNIDLNLQITFDDARHKYR